MGFLRVFDLRFVLVGGGGEELGAEIFLHALSCRPDCLFGEERRVGAHVGDVAAFVESLRRAHGFLRGEVQLAGRLLLKSARGKWSRGFGDHRFFFHGRDFPCLLFPCFGKSVRLGFVKKPHRLCLSRVVQRSRFGIKIFSGCNGLSAHFDKFRLESLGGFFK
ncbi:MAG: hypothetical protein UY79_C0003G0046 [Parcubacteria group bacterium GW2011_GWA2_53_21]|nr:MAG: hypothetical protein UY79_C0003G0046 [Parcubacteria group bacterium GW2011_GWA2_53_21]